MEENKKVPDDPRIRGEQPQDMFAAEPWNRFADPTAKFIREIPDSQASEAGPASESAPNEWKQQMNAFTFPASWDFDKTPIGARPRWLLEEHRIMELYGAIERYKFDQNQSCVQEWSEELMQLMRERYDEPDGPDFLYLGNDARWEWTERKVQEIAKKALEATSPFVDLSGKAVNVYLIQQEKLLDLLELAYGIYYLGWVDAKGLREEMKKTLIAAGRLNEDDSLPSDPQFEYEPLPEIVPRGTKVWVTAESLQWGNVRDKNFAGKYLEPKKEYTVDACDSADWGSTLFLEEIPGKRFNAVHFLTKNPKYVAPSIDDQGADQIASRQTDKTEGKDGEMQN